MCLNTRGNQKQWPTLRSSIQHRHTAGADIWATSHADCWGGVESQEERGCHLGAPPPSKKEGGRKKLKRILSTIQFPSQALSYGATQSCLLGGGRGGTAEGGVLWAGEEKKKASRPVVSPPLLLKGQHRFSQWQHWWVVVVQGMSEHQLHVCSLLGDTQVTLADPWLKTLVKESPPPRASSPLLTDKAWAINLLSGK